MFGRVRIDLHLGLVFPHASRRIIDMQLKYIVVVMAVGGRRSAVQVAIIGIEAIVIVAFLIRCIVSECQRRGIQQLDAAVFTVAVFSEEVITRKSLMRLRGLPFQLDFVVVGILEIQVTRWIARTCRGT